MIYNVAVAAAIIGWTNASPAPAPQVLDFAALTAAATVAIGPTGVAVNQTASVVSTVAVTTSAAPGQTKHSKRNILGGSFGNDFQSIWNCLVYHQCQPASTTSCTTTPYAAKTTATTAKATTPPIITATSNKPSTTAWTTPVTTTTTAASTSVSTTAVTPSTTGTSPTPYWPITPTTSADGACITQPEAGTYCGFINPNDPCAHLPDGYGPKNLTVDEFYADSDFQKWSQNAPQTVASSQSGSVYTQSFKGLNGSIQGNSYLGIYSLQTYDVNKCASICDGVNLCTAFNIFIEHDPSQAPSANDSTAPTVWGHWCPNPAAMTNYRCSLWGSSINSTMATNIGQWQEQFQVVITGSDGYDKTNSSTPVCSNPSSVSSSTVVSTPTATPTTWASTTTPASSTKSSSAGTTMTTTSKSSSTTTSATSTSTGSIPSWGPGHNCHGKGVNNPGKCMGQKVIPGPFNPQLCADYAMAQNAANKAAAIAAGASNFTPCAYINAAYYHANGIPYGTACSLYSEVVDSSYETYTGGFWGETSYSCAQSWTFALQFDASFTKCS